MYVDISEIEVGKSGNVAVLTRDWGSAWTPSSPGPGAPGFTMYVSGQGDFTSNITSVVINDADTATITFSTEGIEYIAFDYITFTDDADFDYSTEIYLQENSTPVAPWPIRPPKNAGLINRINPRHPMARGLIAAIYGGRDLLGPAPTLAGNAAVVTDPAVGLAVALDGTGDYISLPSNPKFNGLAQMSYLGWIYKGTQDIKPWGKATGGTNLFAERSGRFLVGINSTSGTTSIGARPGMHPYGWVYDGSKITVYRDGLADPSTVAATGTINATTGALILGAEYDATDAQDGIYGPAFFWNHALTAAEMALMSAPQNAWALLEKQARVKKIFLPVESEPEPEPETSKAAVKRVRRFNPVAWPIPQEIDRRRPINLALPLTQGLVSLISPTLSPGGNAIDLTDFSYGTGNAVTRVNSSMVGGAHDYNGSTSYMDFGTANKYQIASGGITVAAWVKINSSNRVISARRTVSDGDYINWMLLLTNVDEFYFAYSAAKNTYMRQESDATATSMGLYDGRYHLVSASTVFGQQSTKGKIYIDGLQVAATPRLTGSDGNHTTHGAERMALGASYTSSFESSWDGPIGQSMIWKRQLTDAEQWRLFDPLTRWSMINRKAQRVFMYSPGSTPAPSGRAHYYRNFILRRRAS